MMQTFKSLLFGSILRLGLILSLFSTSGMFLLSGHLHLERAAINAQAHTQSLAHTLSGVDLAESSVNSFCSVCHVAQNGHLLSLSKVSAFDALPNVQVFGAFGPSLPIQAVIFYAYQATAPPAPQTA